MSRGDWDAIVLDLDDTILDTAGLLVPVADRRAVDAMRAAGLAASADAAHATLREIRREGVWDLFGTLAERLGAPPESAAAGTRAFFDFDVPALALDPEIDAALHALARIAPLALVTTGIERTQRQKVARLDIEALFVECVFVPLDASGGKTPALRGLLARRGWRPERVVFAGDRPSSDVRAANETGCRGVLVRSAGGEFAEHEPSCDIERPWRTIGTLADLPALL